MRAQWHCHRAPGSSAAAGLAADRRQGRPQVSRFTTATGRSATAGASTHAAKAAQVCGRHAQHAQHGMSAAVPARPAPSSWAWVGRSQHAQHAQIAQHHRHACAAASGGSGAPAADIDSGAAAPPQRVLTGKKIGIVGGGPAGMLCAAHMARLGAEVEVFELRAPAAVPKATSTPRPADRTIFLGPPAKRSIEAAGLDTDFGPKWRAEGAAMHYPDKPPRFAGPWAKQPFGMQFLALVTQPGIAAHLRAECERVYGAAVAVTHGVHAVAGNVCAGQLVLEDSDGERQERRFDMVVGADGVHSAVRRLMREQDASLKVDAVDSAMGSVCCAVHSPGHPSTYSSLPTASGQAFRAIPEDCSSPLAGCSTTFVYPKPDASSTSGDLSVCTFNLLHSGSQVTFAIRGDKEWLKTPRPREATLAAFEGAFPQLPRRWLQDLADFVYTQTQRGALRVRSPRFIKCNKLASGRAVLLGDAAHALSPNIGMGANSAMQDSQVLAQACIAASGDIAAAARRYSADRLGNAHTVTHVSQQLDADMFYKYHKNIFALVAALPYKLVQMGSRLPPKIPGFLKPGFSPDKIFYMEDDWTQIRGRVWRYMLRLGVGMAAVLTAMCAVLAGLAALAWKGLSLLRV